MEDKPQEGNPIGQAPTGDGQQQSQQQPGGGLTLEQVQAELKAVRAEAAAHRVKANEYEAEIKKRDEAGKSESEKTAAKLAEAEKAASDRDSALKATSLQLAVERAARKMGIVDEDAAFRLLDTSAVKYDADGKPTNVDALLTDLVANRAWLKGALSAPSAPGAGASATNPAGGAGAGVLTIEGIKKMSAQQIANLSDVEYKQMQTVLAGRRG